MVWLPSIWNFPIWLGLRLSSQLTLIIFRGVAQPPTRNGWELVPPKMMVYNGKSMIHPWKSQSNMDDLGVSPWPWKPPLSDKRKTSEVFFFPQHVLFVHENMPLFAQIFKWLLQNCSADVSKKSLWGMFKNIHQASRCRWNVSNMYPLNLCGNSKLISENPLHLEGTAIWKDKDNTIWYCHILPQFLLLWGVLYWDNHHRTLNNCIL